MLTGSVAMNYYAEPRMTRDIYIVVQLRVDSIGPLTQAFSPAYYVDAEAAKEALQREGMFNIIHYESVIKVDCIVRKSSEYRKLEFERRRKVDFGGFYSYIVSREDLILSKLAWAKESRSEMQLNDVVNLLRTGYDEDYVREWSVEIGVEDLLKEVKDG